MAQPMGLGKLGGPGGQAMNIKRKFRWTFKLTVCGGKQVPEHFVKLAARPHLTIEETELNFLNGKTFIPGKGTWEPITVTYYDVASSDNLPLYDWLATMYDIKDPIGLKQGSKLSDYSGQGVLTMYDGCGNPIEEWQLYDCWPTDIDFGEVDYSSNEECTIQLTLRYSTIDYLSICPNAQPQRCECTPCS